MESISVNQIGERLLTSGEAVELLRFSPQWLLRMAKEGFILGVRAKPRSSWRFPLSEIQRFMREGGRHA